MGTSISQPSARNTNWSPVHAGYKNKNVPDTRIIKEIWRACENEDIPMSTILKDKAIYECYSAVEQSKNFQEALQKFSESIIQNKNNSIVAEFARRAIPISFQSNKPTNNWMSCLFSEVTNYIVSRDLSGFIGSNYRNKSVKELILFKKTISNKVSEAIASEDRSISNQKDWNSFIDKSITKLKNL